MFEVHNFVCAVFLVEGGHFSQHQCLCPLDTRQVKTAAMQYFSQEYECKLFRLEWISNEVLL